jgi:hypothetical protein
VSQQTAIQASAEVTRTTTTEVTVTQFSIDEIDPDDAIEIPDDEATHVGHVSVVLPPPPPPERNWWPIYLGTWAAAALLTVVIGGVAGGAPGDPTEITSPQPLSAPVPQRRAEQEARDATVPAKALVPAVNGGGAEAADGETGDVEAPGIEPDGNAGAGIEPRGAQAPGARGDEPAGIDVGGDDADEAPPKEAPPQDEPDTDEGEPDSGGTGAAAPDTGSQRRAVASLGTLRIHTTPALPVRFGTKRVRGALKLTKSSGVLNLGGKRDPFRLKVRYKIAGDGVAVVVESDPWAMVFDKIGSGLGRTPVTLKGGKSHALELANPTVGQKLTLTISFAK